MWWWIGLALAGGQVNHVWHSVEARQHAEGELAAFVNRDDVYGPLVNGSMFPDGGFASGARDAAESAHWERFQDQYLDWIVANHEPPWTDEASQHIAFLLGAASHGMADTLFDAIFIEVLRQRDLDGWANHNADESTDVAFASQAGIVDLPAVWVPAEVLAPFFDVLGDETDVATIERGHRLLFAAYTAVAIGGMGEQGTRIHSERFPWGAANVHAPGVRGNPRDAAPVVARYWQSVWDRLHGRFTPAGLVLATSPADGAFDQVRDAADAESRVFVAMARSLDPGTVSADTVTVVDGEGTAHPVSVRMYYQAGNVLDIRPETDWAADTRYTVTLGVGIEARDGTALESPFSFTFSTEVGPVVDTSVPTADTDAPEPPMEPAAEACGCATGSPAPAWLLLLPLAALSRRERR